MTNVMRKHLRMEETSKFVAGRLWRLADEKVRQAFNRAFTAFLANSSVQSLAKHTDIALAIERSHPLKSDLTQVNSLIGFPNGPRFPVNWLIRNRDGEYSVEDIQFLNISLKNLLRDYVALSAASAGNNLKDYVEVLTKAELLDFGTY